jgi:Tfp pilus assembly protein PilO
LTKQYNDVEPQNLAKLERLLPDSVDNIRLILEIEKVALPYGMALRNVQYDATVEQAAEAPPAPGEITSGKEYGTWELSFTVQGTYTNFVNFMRDLEKNLRIVDVTSVEFNSDRAAEVPGFTSVYQYTVKIKTYWLKN